MKPQLSAPLQHELDHILDFFSKHYPSARLYLVGGAVRDMVMGREVYDLDVECYGMDERTFEEAMERLGAKGVGRSFFVFKLGHIDLSLPRTERKVAPGHRGFEVRLAHDTKEASRRRDFTMNALMLDLQNGEIVDHWGGLEDIRRRRIRVVDPRTFVEDSLRVLRAMQFSARLKFRVEKRSRDLMCGMDLDDLTPERIFREFEKMFEAPHPHYGLFTMADLGIDRKILGFAVGPGNFRKIARHMVRAAECADLHMRPYLFLFVLACDMHLNVQRLCERIHTPNIYKKVLGYQRCVPSRMTDRFLGGLALRFPLRQWLGIWSDRAAERAKRLGIYEERFDPGIRPADLLEEGYAGRELGEELRARIRREVRRRFAGTVS
ncbi:CCA tRNA nucleotidyltransferase [Hydrogenimonas sp.]